MKDKILSIAGIVVIIVGAVISYFAGFQLADITGFAVEMFGAGLAAASFWNKRNKEKPVWTSVTAVVCIAVGSFLLGFGGVAEATMTTVISSIFGICVIIAGIICAAIGAKN